jgi:hypothetical protein
MKKLLLLYLFFSTTLSFSQISSEYTHFFDDELEILLSQLEKKTFSTLNILIKTTPDGYLTTHVYENYNLKYINDTLLKLEEMHAYDTVPFDSVPNDKVYVTYFNFKSGWLTDTSRDDLLQSTRERPTYKTSDTIIDLTKDSLDYIITNRYVIRPEWRRAVGFPSDTTQWYYERKRFDSEKRLIHLKVHSDLTYKTGPDNIKDYELEITYPDSLTTIVKRYETEKGKRFLYDITTTNVVYKERSEEIIEKTIWHPNSKRKNRSTEIVHKTINYDSNHIIKGVDYIEEHYVRDTIFYQKNGVQIIVTVENN